MSILTYPLGFIGGGKDDFYNGVMENSVRTNAGDSPTLKRTPAVAGNTTTWTISLWLKRGGVGINDAAIGPSFLSTHDSGTDRHHVQFNADNQLRVAGIGASPNVSGTGYQIDWDSVGRFRDPSAWYHIVHVTDTTNAIGADRIRTYVNGDRAATGTLYSTPGQGQVTNINSTAEHDLFGYDGTYGKYFDGYMTDYYMIDGYALGPENFGEYKNGVWIPKAYAGPPPLITDSSSGNLEVTNTKNKGHESVSVIMGKS